jgi:protein gp37
MNKTAIPWCDLTWNPIVGCRNACGVTAENPNGWCYARRIATTRLAHLCPKCATFEPHYHQERFADPMQSRGRPGVVFADSMSDWWSPGVEQTWRFATMNGMYLAPQHRFVVLTKRPDCITGHDIGCWPSNAWLGVSITSGADWWRWEALAKLPGRIHKFISVEPLLGNVAFDKMPWRNTDDPGILPSWCIVGPMSGKSAAVPHEYWQRDLRYVCALLHIPLFEKSGLPCQPPVRALPPDLLSVFRKRGQYGL